MGAAEERRTAAPSPSIDAVVRSLGGTSKAKDSLGVGRRNPAIASRGSRAGALRSQDAESARGSWRWRSSSTGDSAAPSAPDDRSRRRAPSAAPAGRRR